MRTTIRKILPLLLAAIFMASCGGAPVRPDIDTSGLVWPSPPALPRIKYVAVYRDNRDIEKPDFAARLMGGDDVRLSIRWTKAVAVDDEGRIYVTHRGGVAVFDTVKGRMRTFADMPGPGGIQNGRGIAIAPDGRIFIADNVKNLVLVYSPKNEFLMQIGREGEFGNPQGLAIDPARKRLYVTDAKNHSLRAYDLEGKFLFSIDSVAGMPDKERFNAPIQVAVNSKGTIYLVSTIPPRVLVFNPEGDFLSVFGGIGTRTGNFVRPKGVAIDSDDNVYVTDAAFDNFQIFDSENNLLTYVSSGGRRLGELSLPAMIFIDKHDRIYIADRQNHRVQVFQYMSDLYYREHPEVEQPEPPPEEAGKE